MPGVRQVKVIAHRGASGYLPEHTLPAKAMAHAMGVDYLEQDVVLTKDGIPIVLHDIHLDTVTDVARQFPGRHRDDGRFYAIDFTLAEVQSLSASERFNAKTGKAVYPSRFPVRHGTFQIPTLREELELIQGLNTSTGRDVGIYPELKHPQFHHNEGQDLGQTVLKVLSEFGYTSQADNCLLQCFDGAELQRLRSDFGCKLTCVQLLSEADWMRGPHQQEQREIELAKIAEYAQAIGPSVNGVFRSETGDRLAVPTELVLDAHRFKLMIHPWTYRADDVPKMFRSFEDLHRATVMSGIDGVFSDFPDRSIQLLQEFA